MYCVQTDPIVPSKDCLPPDPSHYFYLGHTGIQVLNFSEPMAFCLHLREPAKREGPFDPHSGKNDDRDKDCLALMMELLGMMPCKVVSIPEISLTNGDLRHIQRLRFWPLNKILMEKYDFSVQDANDMADFFIPILDFALEMRPTTAQPNALVIYGSVQYHGFVNLQWLLLNLSTQMGACLRRKEERRMIGKRWRLE
ncbi:hypothetical protein SLEP1_g44196 [Rubroshorea leprosula]|uniref:non-specific serine/threonine protein kinase n=1 Tax=Rubroshorea leprosula TaxID=152421 RepID=A0AAV5LGN7_9ROSI|nr:hypothetical protein SLEP1_g44196 [Rubroshorea leprosula]